MMCFINCNKYEIRRALLLCCSVFCSSVIFCSPSGYWETKEQSETNKYAFHEGPLLIRFNISPFATIESVSGELFGLQSSDGAYRMIVIDWDREEKRCRAFFNVNHKVKRYVFNDVDLNTLTTISITADFKNDYIELAINDDTTTVNGMYLSLNERYRYAILPNLSVSPGEDMYPVFIISNLTVSTALDNPHKMFWGYILIIFINLLIIISLFIHRRIRKHRKNHIKDDIRDANPFGNFDMPLSGAIYLFGGLKIYNLQGVDISRQLSPILREVLSLLIVHSAGIGISSAKLTEILWNDMPFKNARNNRSVYFNKLRKLLSTVGDIKIENSNNYWKIKCDNVFVDYLYYKKKMDLPEKFSKETIGGIISVLRSGNILPEMDYLWLDEVKSEISNEVMDRLLAYGESDAVKNNPAVYITISEILSKLDSFNEDALIFRCKAYVLLGRHQSARSSYDKFCIEYKSVYNEDFPIPFVEIVK